MPRKGKTHGLKIFQRYHFASALKRMSVIAGHTPPGSVDTDYIASVKGAPETLRSMVSNFLYIQEVIVKPTVYNAIRIL